MKYSLLINLMLNKKYSLKNKWTIKNGDSSIACNWLNYRWCSLLHRQNIPPKRPLSIMNHNSTRKKNCTRQLFSWIVSADYSFLMPYSFEAWLGTKIQSIITQFWHITDKQTSGDSPLLPSRLSCWSVVLLSPLHLPCYLSYTHSHIMVLFAFQTVAWERTKLLNTKSSA